MTPEERAWSEYLAHCRGADPDQYVQTEQLAWTRLCLTVPAMRLRDYSGARLALPPGSTPTEAAPTEGEG